MSEREEKKLIERPPVVVVMGHIDHGKTKLLDAIRETKVVESEAGGITQSIGAYQVEQKGKKITFIDTPGHQAFVAMRSHGARVADLAILVVAADEGPKEQTWESYRIIKEANIPILVAINKIDKPEADVIRTKNQLLEGGIYLEGMGVDVPVVEISAKEKIGLDQLLDLLILMAEMLELKADPTALASGLVIESHKDPKRGNAATLIIKDGTLHRGEFIATPSVEGKVRILENFLHKPINSASLSDPVLVIGFESLPEVGEEFLASFSEEDLRAIKEKKGRVKLEKKESVEELVREGEIISLVLKANTLGSLEALKEIVKNVKKSFPDFGFKVVKEGIGDISEEDAKIAESSQALILGFGVKKRVEADFYIQKANLKVFLADIIYDLEKVLREWIEKMIEEKESVYSGQLEVLAVFSQRKKEQLIGGKVIKGQVKNKSKFDIFREEESIGKGVIKNLRIEKADVNLVEEGKECGLLIESEEKIEKGDILKIKK